MIEINLIEKRRDGIKVPALMGIDFKQVNWLAWISSLVLMWLISFSLNYYYDIKIDGVRQVANNMNKNLKILEKKVQDNEKVRDMLVEFEKINDDLKVRTEHIKSILSQKSNPRRIFERISADIPPEVWLTKLTVLDRKIEIEGQAISYEEIGKFIMQSNQSKFFGKTLKLSNEQVKTVSVDFGGQKKNVELFKIVGDIVTFD